MRDLDNIDELSNHEFEISINNSNKSPRNIDLQYIENEINFPRIHSISSKDRNNFYD